MLRLTCQLCLLLLLLHSNGCYANKNVSEQLQSLQRLQQYLWGYAATSFSCFGIVGNAVSIVVLLSPRMSSSTSVYLVTLGVLDIVVLVLFDVCMGLPLVLAVFSRFAQPGTVLIRVLYPLSLFIHMSNMYITMCFTVERYVSVQFPLKSSRWCTKRRAKMLICCIMAFTFMYNVPRAFEGASLNGAELQNNWWYSSIYSGVMYTLFMYVLPLLVIVASNALLTHAVRVATQRCGRADSMDHKRHERDFSISVMLASVVAVFVFCQTFSLIDNLLAVGLRTPPKEPSLFQQAFYAIAQFMIVVNSSVNFILYCFFGVKFRQELRLLFCRRSRTPPGNRTDQPVRTVRRSLLKDKRAAETAT